MCILWIFCVINPLTCMGIFLLCCDYTCLWRIFSWNELHEQPSSWLKKDRLILAVQGPFQYKDCLSRCEDFHDKDTKVIRLLCLFKMGIPLMVRQHLDIESASLGSECFRQTRSVSWQLMPWLHVLPGYQQPWYWLCKRGRSLFSMLKDSD